MAVLVNVPDLSKSISNEDFNKFIEENLGYILSITPHNPVITKDDEWRTDDYSKYDEIRESVKKEILN